jgi:hypothetical protein
MQLMVQSREEGARLKPSEKREGLYQGAENPPHAVTEANPGKLPCTPPSGLTVPGSWIVVLVDGVDDPFEAATPPAVASVAAASAVAVEVGGGSGAFDTPGRGAEPSGTNDDDRSFLLSRSLLSSSVLPLVAAVEEEGTADVVPLTEGCNRRRRRTVRAIEDMRDWGEAGKCRSGGGGRQGGTGRQWAKADVVDAKEGYVCVRGVRKGKTSQHAS